MAENKKTATRIEWAGDGKDLVGYDGPVVESDEEKQARRAFLAQYGDLQPSVELDEYGDPVDDQDIEPADETLLAAAQTLADPKANQEMRDEARAIILESPGLEEFVETDDADDEPLTREGRISELAEAVRRGNAPIDEYAVAGDSDPAEDTRRAVQAVATEQAVTNKMHELLGTPGHGIADRPENERNAIRAVRAALLAKAGIESADLDAAPEVDIRQAANDAVYGTDEANAAELAAEFAEDDE